MTHHSCQQIASAKIRTGPPKDDKEDYLLSIWAGVIPIEQTLKDPIADPKLNTDIIPGPEVTQLYH